MSLYGGFGVPGGGNADADHLYFNVGFVNTAEEGHDPGAYPVASYGMNWQSNVLPNVSDYKFTVVRLVLDGPGRILPVFIPRIQIHQPDPDLTIYTLGIEKLITFTAGANQVPFTARLYAARRIRHVNKDIHDVPSLLAGVHDVGAPAPTAAAVHLAAGPPLMTQDLSGGMDYYSYYSLQDWIDRINETLWLCQEDVGAPLDAYKLTPSIREQMATLMADAVLVSNWNPAQAGSATIDMSSPPPRFQVNSPGATFSVIGDEGTYGGKYSSQEWGQLDQNAATYPFASNYYTPWTKVGPHSVSLIQNTNETSWIWLDPMLRDLFLGLPMDCLNNPKIPALAYRLRFDHLASGGLQRNVSLVNGGIGATPTCVMGYRLSPTASPYDPLKRYGGSLWPVLTLTQEAPSTDCLWSPVESVVLTSARLPIVPEKISSPGVTAQENSTMADSGLNIIADFVIQRTAGAYEGTGVLYSSPIPYRWSSLIGNQALSGIDFQLFWKCRLDGTLHPLRMPNASSVNLKILFEKI